MDKKYDVIVVGGGPLRYNLSDPTFKTVSPVTNHIKREPKMLSNMQKILMLTAGLDGTGTGVISSFLEEQEKEIAPKETKVKEITEADLKRIEKAKMKRERKARKLFK